MRQLFNCFKTVQNWEFCLKNILLNITFLKKLSLNENGLMNINLMLILQREKILKTQIQYNIKTYFHYLSFQHLSVNKRLRIISCIFCIYPLLQNFLNFFYDVVTDNQIRNGLFKLAVFCPELCNFVGSGLSHRVAGKLFLSSLDKFFVPFVEWGFLDAVLSAKFGDRGFCAQGFYHNQNFLLCGKCAPCFSSDVLDEFFRCGLLYCFNNIQI